MSASIYPIRITTGAKAVMEKLSEHMPGAAHALTGGISASILALHRDSATTCVAVVVSNDHNLYQWSEGPMLSVLDHFQRTLETHGLPQPDEDVLRHAGLACARA